MFKADDNEIVGNNSRADEMAVNSSSKNSTYVPNIGVIEESNFLTPNVKKTFNRLKQAFIKASILQYFDLESHIQIKTDALGYPIGEILSQLNFKEIVLSNFS